MPNKRNAERAEKFAATGKTDPLDAITEVLETTLADYRALRGEDLSDLPKPYRIVAMETQRKLADSIADYASKAAPYLHAKLAAVSVTGANGKPIQVESKTTLDVSKLSPAQIAALAAIRVPANNR